mgnify:CR=1 FL=1
MCESCALWDRQGSKEGLCRAMAPRTHVVGEDGEDFVIRTLWPLTRDQDWCGRWRRRL